MKSRDFQGLENVLSKFQGFQGFSRRIRTLSMSIFSSIGLFMVILFIYLFIFTLQCNLTWMRGNFGLKLRNSLTYMLDYIVMQMRKTNREKRAI